MRWMMWMWGLLSIAGCGVLNLGQDLQQAQRELQVIDGHVTREGPLSGPLFVVLLDDQPTPNVLAMRTLQADGAFKFLSEQGPRQLLAFIDSNGDFRLDAQEPRLWLKSPSSRALHLATAANPESGNHLSLGANSLAPAPLVDLKLERLKAHNPRFKSNYLAPVSLADKRFDSAVTQQGMWQPLQFLRETGHGLYLLEPWDPRRTPVLLVHGINDSPRAWAPLLQAIDQKQFQVFLYHYPSSWQVSSNASLLAEAWRDTQLRLGFKHFHVLAHSMGGLLARDFIRQLAEQSPAVLGACQFISLSTPWAGHAAAQQGVERSPVVAPVWRNLAPHSEFLQNLWQFSWPPSVQHTLVASYAGDSLFVAEKSDGVVSLASQLYWPAQEQAQQVRLVEADHVGVLQHAHTHTLVKRQLAMGCGNDH